MSKLHRPTLFFDIGGVLLSNGWDHSERKLAAERFGLEGDEYEDRHRSISFIYETGGISLDEYLRFAVFHTERPFTRDEFKAFMFSQTRPYRDMIGFVRELRARFNVMTAALNNEGRELNIHRIQKFNLAEIIDVFISSCFVHKMKPDPGMFHAALDITQAAPERSIYVEDRAAYVEVARSLGFNAVHHANYGSTRAALLELLEKMS